MQERVGNLEKDLALKEAQLAAVQNAQADQAAAAAAEASVAGVPDSEEAAAAVAVTAEARGAPRGDSERSLQAFATQFTHAVRVLRQWLQERGLLGDQMVRRVSRLVVIGLVSAAVPTPVLRTAATPVEHLGPANMLCMLLATLNSVW